MVQGRLSILVAATLTFSAVSSFGKTEYVEAVPGEYVVVLKSGYKPRVSTFKTAFRAESVEALTKAKNMLLIKKNPIERQDFAIAEIEALDGVSYVEPNYIYRISSPNDPLFIDLWGLSNSGQKSGQAGVDIGALRAWEISKGSHDIVVGVIDTGIDYNHPDLKNNIWTNSAEKNGTAGVDDDKNGYIDDIHGYDFASNDADPIDDHNHGTHVSGTIGAAGDDGVGVVGVNWKVKLMALKFLSASGSGSLAGAVKAIDYATENGAHLTNNSWGGGGFSQALYDSIERAQQKGKLFVAASGNESRNNDVSPGYPASYDLDNIISVAAVDRTGNLAQFSNYGEISVDVGAPGVEVMSSIVGGQYKEYRGTSMASPHVAGIAALILSDKPNMSWQEVRDRIIKTAKPLESLAGKTVSGGLADAYLAMTNQLPPPDQNNPKNWKRVVIAGETSHPYESNKTQEWIFEQAGAQSVAVYFEKFETEQGYDTVSFYNRAGTLVKAMSGKNDGKHGPVVAGDYVRVVFKSDASVNGYGLTMTALAFKAE